MIFSRAWFALMRRNLIYRRRNPLGLLLEISLPVIFVGTLVLLKGAAERAGGLAATPIPQLTPNETHHTYAPFSFRDYLTALQAEKVCILEDKKTKEAGYEIYSISGIANKGVNWVVPHVKCDSELCEYHGQDALPFCEFPGMAIAPSTVDDTGGAQRARDFRDWLYERYPVLVDGGGGNRAKRFENFVQIFDSTEEIDRYVTHANYGNAERPKIAMGVVWQGNDPKSWRYTLRQNSTNVNSPEKTAYVSWTTPDTQRLFNSYGRSDFEVCIPQGAAYLGYLGWSCTGQYLYNGILTFQRLAQDYILSRTGAEDAGYGVAENGVQFVQFPSEAFTESGFYATIQDLGPLMVMLGIIYPVASMVGYICQEKELRQKELMKMMSVGESDIAWAWFASFLITNILTTIPTTFMSTMLYVSSEFKYLLYFWFLTLLACSVFAMTVATLSSKTARGVMIGLLVFFLGIFLTIVVPIDYRTDSGFWIRMISVHPVAAFSYGLQEIGRLEDQGTGVQSYTIDFTDNPSGYTFSNTIRNLISSTIFWGVLSWYLNRVIKPDYGQALPMTFPFQLSYWFPGRYSQGAGEDAFSSADDYKNNQNIPMEPVSDALKRQAKEGESIEIKGLRKQFGENTAVDGLTLSMYSGQITALLGHNGAGKTTTINMLTGAMAPTAGDAVVAGKNIRTQLPELRQSLGICLQHDCLFPNLTVREHLLFFARLKGLFSKVSREEAERHVDEAIQDVALSEKSNTLSKNLSGGMKRKLSVAIAFCGGSNVVLLDEPTSGMDPFSRRFTWNVIRQYRQGRCIILTTHFMDEADILGDRIAIMAEGQLRCAGSSLFLKRTYGVGYNLTIEKSGDELDVENTGLPVIPERKRPDPPGAWFRIVKNPGDVSKAGSGTANTPETPEESTSDSLLSDDPSEVELSLADMPNDQKASIEQALATAEGKTNDEKLQSIVTSAVEDAALLSSAGSEISFQLPMEASASFSPMFEKLDYLVDVGFLTSYGLSLTTIDEVFLAVAKGETGEKTSMRSSKRGIAKLPESSSPTKSIRSQLELTQDQNVLFRHLCALFIKRAAFFRRDKKAWLCTTILPSIFVCIGFIIFLVATPDRNFGPMTLDLADYNNEVAVEPRNPIVVNSPDNPFTCQPGNCAYQPIVYENVTNEIYFYCGFKGRFFNYEGLDIDELLTWTPEQLLDLAKDQIYNCTLANSGNVASRITDSGAETQLRDVETVGQASASLRASKDMYAATQFGGIYFTHDSSSVIDYDDTGKLYDDFVVQTCRTRPGNYTSTSQCDAFARMGYVIQYNFTALHASPLYQGLADEALVREANNDDDYDIEVTIHPLPFTVVEGGFYRTEDGGASWFLICLSFPFIGGAFAGFIVKERESKAKHLQTVAGVKPIAYWLSTFMWDILNYQIPLWTIVMLMFAFDVHVYTNPDRGIFSAVLAILLLFGPAVAGFSYCVSYAFSSATKCNMFLVIFGFLIGLGGPMACSILLLLGNDPLHKKEHLIGISHILQWVLRIFPQFCLGKGLYWLIGIDLFLLLEGSPEGATAWSPEVIRYDVAFLAWESVAYVFFAICLDVCASNPSILSMWRQAVSIVTFGWLRSSGNKDMMTLAPTEDDDVVKEQDRVLSGEANDDLIVVKEFTKVYDDGKVAVNNISLGIPPGECFGLLGINGAGKTTTLAMLTAEFPPTSGDAKLAGFSVTRQPEKTRRRIGYCPQFDAHFANLTGREHVVLYASIKGVPSHMIQEAARAKLAEVGLSEKDSDRLSSGYSGGMKRRLSLACATIGQPQIVFLDECTTGVDPVARREIWKLVSDMVSGENVAPEDRTSVILTTHSMEECEALCPRIGIMANGRLRCLGSGQHLKNKFGKGYQVEMKIHVVNESDDDLRSNTVALGATMRGQSSSSIEAADADEKVFNLAETLAALESLTGDRSLSSMVTDENTIGYAIWKDATSECGVPLSTLAAFATLELRMKELEAFVFNNYPEHVFRERQDTKARYEVSSEGGVRISSIFSTIEANKERLRLADYGVSQTSLEQVFNLHAAEAERFKQGRID